MQLVLPCTAVYGMFRLQFSVRTKDLAKVNCSGSSFSGADVKELQCLLDDDHLMKSVFLIFCNSFVFIGLFVWAVMWRVPNSTDSTLLRGYKSQFGVGQPCRPWREWLCLAWQESGADTYPETLINTDKCGMGAFKPWRNPGLWRLWVQVMVQLMLLTCSHNFSDGFGSWLMTTWCRLYVIVSLEIVLWWGGESTRRCLRWDHMPACL